ncbi:MAG: DUF1828 domain-containing protein [Deltaproteobacteria bacterium]|nr:DUF1828 domain-containing protein [Deltaproteobacteria bacterium]
MVVTQPQNDIVRDYLNWLRERIKVVEHGNVSVLSTPFLDPFHDGIQVFIERSNGEFVLHDNGNTLENLQCLGVKIEDSARRKALIERAIAGCAVQLTKQRLETMATSANLSQRAHYLLTAILRLNDLWMSHVPHTFADFFEIVAEFLDGHNVLYTANVSIPGRTVEHPMDFVIPLPRKREKLVKLIGSPSPQTAKVVSFTWMELKEVRPTSQRVVVLNDVRSPDPLVEESEEAFRQVSDQTVAILRGYSDAIFRWSGREKPEFAHLWLPNGSNQAAT